MPRFWARWYEPKVDPWLKAQSVIADRLGCDNQLATDEAMHASGRAIAALREANFEIEWPFWEIPAPRSALHVWKSGEAMTGEYMVVCAVFDAQDEDTVRHEIGDRQSISVDPKPDDWLPGDRFPILAK